MGCIELLDQSNLNHLAPLALCSFCGQDSKLVTRGTGDDDLLLTLQQSSKGRAQLPDWL